jgi:hypothetical protein
LLSALGKSWCGYYGLRNHITCNLSNVLVTETPDTCTTLVYTGLNIDLDLNVTDFYENFGNIIQLLNLIYTYNIALRNHQYLRHVKCIINY